MDFLHNSEDMIKLRDSQSSFIKDVVSREKTIIGYISKNRIERMMEAIGFLCYHEMEKKDLPFDICDFAIEPSETYDDLVFKLVSCMLWPVSEALEKTISPEEQKERIGGLRSSLKWLFIDKSSADGVFESFKKEKPKFFDSETEKKCKDIFSGGGEAVWIFLHEKTEPVGVYRMQKISEILGINPPAPSYDGVIYYYEPSNCIFI